ncbi:MAG TPA: glycoside hydrolase family 15 protein [Candidatus Micrarchaeia archaeon]|nr:glycoside hydrolase family 15 protein [Candidatus Micrarchaeia archaeon]
MPRPRYQPLSEYGVIGDLHTVALIDRSGAIDWLCAPRFDSPFVFGRLLDADRGGSMTVEPNDPSVPDSRRYLESSNVLETVLSTARGRLQLTDFMVAREHLAHPDDDHVLVRRLTALDGDLELVVRVDARCRYGQASAPATIAGEGGRCLLIRHDETVLHLDGPVGWEADGDSAVQRLRLRAGEPAWVLLSYGAGSTRHRERQPHALLTNTQRYWERWIATCDYDGPYPGLVRRSALALKLLIYAPEGSIVAAPTTSLPEWIGGSRNWDYRFTWLRDSAFFLYSLQVIGYHDEASRFMGWIERVHRRQPQHFRIMYGIDGRSDIPELELGHLEGYMGSQPVRIGNAAADQRQLDIYGEIVDAAYLHHRFGRGDLHPMRPILLAMLAEVCEHWTDADSGIWEVRGGPRQFLYSKLQCWVALDRGLRLADDLRADPATRRRWARTREEIRHAILTRGWSDRLQAFRQALDEDALDATALMLPLLRFLSPMDDRMRRTVDTIRRQLTDDHGFVYRYRSADGLAEPEGTFMLCSFWLVDVLAEQGQTQAARELFERLISHGNDLGLFSEEVDASAGTLLGNFPQAFTHVAVINAAAHLERGARPHPILHGG